MFENRRPIRIMGMEAEGLLYYQSKISNVSLLQLKNFVKIQYKNEKTNITLHLIRYKIAICMLCTD